MILPFYRLLAMILTTMNIIGEKIYSVFCFNLLFFKWRLCQNKITYLSFFTVWQLRSWEITLWEPQTWSCFEKSLAQLALPQNCKYFDHNHKQSKTKQTNKKNPQFCHLNIFLMIFFFLFFLNLDIHKRRQSPRCQGTEEAWIGGLFWRNYMLWDSQSNPQKHCLWWWRWHWVCETKQQQQQKQQH